MVYFSPTTGIHEKRLRRLMLLDMEKQLEESERKERQEQEYDGQPLDEMVGE